MSGQANDLVVDGLEPNSTEVEFGPSTMPMLKSLFDRQTTTTTTTDSDGAVVRGVSKGASMNTQQMSSRTQQRH